MNGKWKASTTLCRRIIGGSTDEQDDRLSTLTLGSSGFPCCKSCDRCAALVARRSAVTSKAAGFASPPERSAGQGQKTVWRRVTTSTLLTAPTPKTRKPAKCACPERQRPGERDWPLASPNTPTKQRRWNALERSDTFWNKPRTDPPRPADAHPRRPARHRWPGPSGACGSR